MWVEIEEDLAAALQREVALGESRERMVQGLILEALRGRAPAPHPAARRRVDVAGSLKQLLDSGLVAEDDEIRYTEVRRRKVHVGRIDADGRIHTDMGVNTSPSTALRQLVNYSMNGWKCWIHVATGKSLAELRAELGSHQ
jgi:Restriction Enzyme Adenine Methylase Associated